MHSDFQFVLVAVNSTTTACDLTNSISPCADDTVCQEDANGNAVCV